MQNKNKLRLWWIKHGFGNKVKIAETWINSLVEDEGWVTLPPFKINSPEEAVTKGLKMIREEAEALGHIYKKIIDE